MNYIQMPPRNTTAETLAQAISKYLKMESSKHFPLTQIGDVAEITSGGTPDTNNSTFWDGDIVWITPKDLGRPRDIEIITSERRISTTGVSSSSAKLLPIGTVLLSSRAPIGHLGISHTPLATNQGFKNIICKHRLYNRFLFHMLRGSISDLQSFGRGNTFAEIPSRIVKEYAIPLPPVELQKIIADFLDTFYKRLLGNNIPLPHLPPPLADQQRIVAKIERLAGKIEEAHKIRASAVVETETIFQSAIYNAWSNQQSWHKARIGEVVKIVSGQIDPRLEPYASMPHINGESMQAKTGRLLNNYRAAKEDGVKSGKFHFKPGSILYSKIRPYLRKAVIAPFEGICSADVYAIEELDKRIKSSFMKYTLISPQFTTYANQKSGRTRMPKLNQNQIFDYIMAFPSIEEQNKIALHLDNLQAMTDHLKVIQSQTAAELDAMLPSILDKAFKGEL